jgi:hypothetical protein|mmetsp:Transcript_6212/g.11599  ORF Transcript_6212/g.11599 Transcript_6212/m.11599 type:complete len:201 (-) Transcript_6212:1270-1872(-)
MPRSAETRCLLFGARSQGLVSNCSRQPGQSLNPRQHNKVPKGGRTTGGRVGDPVQWKERRSWCTLQSLMRGQKAEYSRSFGGVCVNYVHNERSEVDQSNASKANRSAARHVECWRRHSRLHVDTWRHVHTCKEWWASSCLFARVCEGGYIRCVIVCACACVCTHTRLGDIPEVWEKGVVPRGHIGGHNHSPTLKRAIIQL